MRIPDWLLPWRAKKRICLLESRVPQDVAKLETALNAERSKHNATREQLSHLEGEHQKTQLAVQALAAWIKEAHRNDKQ